MTELVFKVDEANTFVRVSNYDKKVEGLIREFCFRNLTSWDKVPGEQFNTFKYAVGHVYATFTPDRKEFRVNKSFYKSLLEYLTLKGVDVEGITPKLIEEIVPLEAEFKWKDFEVKPRNEAQEEYLDFLLREDKRLVVINAGTGQGKTVITIMGFVKLGYRVIITILPRYVPIWIESFNKFLDLKPEDILNVSDHDINDVYEAFKEGTINPKIVFFQLTRIDTYIKRMREFPETIPHLDDFFKVMQGGVRIIDEAHESIYSVYSSMLYGNLNKNVALSATLRGDNAFINKIYEGAFPAEAYLKPPVYQKYIRVINYLHRMNVNKHRVRTVSFGGYSHVLYEQSILRKKYLFDSYYKMCKEAFENHYLENKREGQKAMFFFSTVKMCNAFAEALQKDYPHLDIFVFTGEISKKKGMAQEYARHEIVITTPTSCGTGKDIEKLFVVFAGVSVSSSQRVDQMAGRLRSIDKWWPDLDPIYLTFVCKDIKKQIDYASKRKQVLNKTAKSFELVDSGFYI